MKAKREAGSSYAEWQWGSSVPPVVGVGRELREEWQRPLHGLSGEKGTFLVWQGGAQGAGGWAAEKKLPGRGWA